MNLALLDLEVYSFENLLAIDRGMEVFDVELAHVMTDLGGFTSASISTL